VTASAPDFEAGPGELLFVPLGGAHEIGMNMSLYGYEGQWLMVDCGVSFADESSPGVELILPDPQFIAERRDRLAGILITHAHEDHIGAVAWLWRRLRRPIWCSPFAAAMMQRKLIEAGIANEVTVNTFPIGGGARIGPFEISSIPVTHSIPESQAIAITTRLGTVLHATDWKLDPDPLVGPVTDEAALKRLGDAGVIAMTCDSTNVFVPGATGSEAAVRESLITLFAGLKNRIAVTCFSSNIARIESIAHAAAVNGRNAALIGRSMWTVTEAARETGYLATTDPFVAEYDAGHLPRDKAVYIMTGSQGEARSALARIANDDHPEVVLDPGDTVVFSSRVIPGNEKAIGRLQNALARLGAAIVTDDDHFVHVSGHPARDDLQRMYELVRPRLVVPIHGETRHLYEHARYVTSLGVPETLVAENGAVVRLVPGPAEIVGHAPVGRIAIDGTRFVPAEGEVLKMRRRMAFGGAAVATVVLDRKGRLAADPRVAVPGLLDGDTKDQRAVTLAVDAVAAAIHGLKRDQLDDDAAIEEVVRIAVRRSLRDSIGKRPLTQVQIVRI
jgi:ribonuclease J